MRYDDKALTDLLIGKKPSRCTTAGNNAISFTSVTKKEAQEDLLEQLAVLGIKEVYREFRIVNVQPISADGPKVLCAYRNGTVKWRRARSLRTK